MRQNKWWQFLHSLGLEFWLPLPLLGLAFMLVSGLVTQQSLDRDDRAIESFQVTPDRAQPANKILYVKVIVDRERDISLVRVKRATQVYQKQEFELATTEMERVSTAISKKLGLSPERVRQLLRYQVKE